MKCLRLRQTSLMDAEFSLCVFQELTMATEERQKSNTSSNWFSECQHPFIDKNNGRKGALFTKRTAIRPGSETVSQHQAAHAQKKNVTRFINSFHLTRFINEEQSRFKALLRIPKPVSTGVENGRNSCVRE